MCDDCSLVEGDAQVSRWRRASGPLAAAVVMLLVGVVLSSGWIDWPRLGQWSGRRAPWLAAFAAAAMFAGVGGWTWWWKSKQPPRRRAPGLSWWTVVAAGVVVGVVAWGATSWLLTEANSANDRGAARVDAIKTGLGIGAGTTGIFALLLAVRRQTHQEHTAADISLDATERRVTELYTKAVEQLGSAKAPVRLGGLYALERLGESHEDQRSTIINVICAYLRMRYAWPAEPADDATPEQLDRYEDRLQENQVRVTAQRILSRHRDMWTERLFWRQITIDLTEANLRNVVLARTDLVGATLIRANLANADLTDAFLNDAQLIRANLADATLTKTRLSDADLTGVDLTSANLTNARLARANLTEAIFTDAELTGATLIDAKLNNADFTSSGLLRADMTKASLRSTDLSQARLNDADLTEAVLIDANLTDARLIRAQLTNADLTVAQLVRANLTNADLTNADLTRANLAGADLTDADLTDANLTLADLTDANLTNTNLDHAGLSGAILTGACVTDATRIRLPPHYEVRDNKVVMKSTSGDADHA